MILEADMPSPQTLNNIHAVQSQFLLCRNTINGRLYKDDPTIFAWDLINEPRCDCFPEQIPPPPELVSCRPECAVKMQAILLW